MKINSYHKYYLSILWLNCLRKYIFIFPTPFGFIDESHLFRAVEGMRVNRLNTTLAFCVSLSMWWFISRSLLQRPHICHDSPVNPSNSKCKPFFSLSTGFVWFWVLSDEIRFYYQLDLFKSIFFSIINENDKIYWYSI